MRRQLGTITKEKGSSECNDLVNSFEGAPKKGLPNMSLFLGGALLEA